MWLYQINIVSSILIAHFEHLGMRLHLKFEDIYILKYLYTNHICASVRQHERLILVEFQRFIEFIIFIF